MSDAVIPGNPRPLPFDVVLDSLGFGKCAHPDRPVANGPWVCPKCARTLVLSGGMVTYENPTMDEEEARRELARHLATPPPRPDPLFSIGDVVMLKSGGLHMTVAEVVPEPDGFSVAVAFSVLIESTAAFGECIRRESFHELMLVKAP
jgi:hypothetical protein